MFTDAQLRSLFERVFEQMLKAGWLREFSYTDDKGWHVIWTPQGAQRAILLRQIITAFKLADDDRAPVAFGVFLKGEGPALFSHWTQDADLASVWGKCCDELFLQGDGDGLQALVHIILGWGPQWEMR